MSDKKVSYDIESDNIDDIAYQLYLDEQWDKMRDNDDYEYWETQHHFRMWEDNKKYYEQANIILRKRKIKNIKKNI